MNTANLQLEGILIAIVELNRLMVAKGIVSNDDIDRALSNAEQSARENAPESASLSNANREAILFPIKLLMLANDLQRTDTPVSFNALTEMLGRMKVPAKGEI